MKKYKEAYPIIITVLVFIITFAVLNMVPKSSEQVLGGRSGGTGSNIGSSVSEMVTAGYDALAFITGPIHLERIIIGNKLTAGGITIDNATASNNDAIKIAEFYGAEVGSYEMGIDLNLGLLITTSDNLNATFIYTEY